jgi:hypothetical protein
VPATTAVDLLAALVLEDDRRWGEVAYVAALLEQLSRERSGGWSGPSWPRPGSA